MPVRNIIRICIFRQPKRKADTVGRSLISEKEAKDMISKCRRTSLHDYKNHFCNKL